LIPGMRKSVLILPGLVLTVALLVLWASRIKPANSDSAVPGRGTTLAPVPAQPSGEGHAAGASGTPDPVTGQRVQPAQIAGSAPAPSAQSDSRTTATLPENALKQIQAFQTAKRSRNAVQHKLDST